MKLKEGVMMDYMNMGMGMGVNGYNQFGNLYRMANNNYNSAQQLIRVNGIDGAKAFQMQPNNSVALFDCNEDVFYVKQTDGAGFGSIRKFRFEEIKDDVTGAKVNMEQFVTRKDMEDYVKFIVQSSNNANTGAEPNVTNKSTTVTDG